MSKTADKCEGLGALPERAGIGYYYEMDSAPGGKKYVYREADTYTADQMRAYAAEQVAAERERCAKMCLDYAEDLDAWRPLDGNRGATLREAARRMRA